MSEFLMKPKIVRPYKIDFAFKEIMMDEKRLHIMLT